MKRKFIINPASGRGLGPRDLQAMRRYFEARDDGFDHVVGTSREDLITQTRRALHEGADQVVAVGGDGTVNAVVNGFFEKGEPIRPEACLALSRTGTGSDYFKTVAGKRRKVDWRDIVLAPLLRRVDVGELRFLEGQSVPNHFINMVSAGMSGEVVRRKHRQKRVPRALRYLVPTVQSLFSFASERVRLVADGKVVEEEMMALFVGKGVFAGGGMRLGGGVAPDDGWLDITYFRKMGPIEMLRKVGKLYSGSFDGEPKIGKLRAREVRVESDRALPVEFDGELGGTTGIALSLRPAILSVCFPSLS